MVSRQPDHTSYRRFGFSYFSSQQEPPRHRFIRLIMALPIQAEENKDADDLQTFIHELGACQGRNPPSPGLADPDALLPHPGRNGRLDGHRPAHCPPQRPYGHPAGQRPGAGGRGLQLGSGYLASAELYDPVTKTWSATDGALTTGRYGHTATLLGNGQVLVAGGEMAVGPLNSAELYDPDTKTWTATTGTLATARLGHTATLLGNGQVLVAGGATAVSYLTTGELYDPATKTWSATTGTARHRPH